MYEIVTMRITFNSFCCSKDFSHFRLKCVFQSVSCISIYRTRTMCAILCVCWLNNREQIMVLASILISHCSNSSHRLVQSISEWANNVFYCFIYIRAVFIRAVVSSAAPETFFFIMNSFNIHNFSRVNRAYFFSICRIPLDFSSPTFTQWLFCSIWYSHSALQTLESPLSFLKYINLKYEIISAHTNNNVIK